MYTRWLLAALAALALGASALLPGGAAAQTQSLLRFEPFVGGGWVAEGVLSGGHSYTAERRYEWTLDRRFLRIHQRLTVDSVTVEEESWIGWDAATNGLRFWSFASDGSYAEATERPATGENRWIFEGRTVGGRTGDWRMTTLLTDASSFSVLIEMRDGADYTPLMTLAYRRIADLPPAPPDPTLRTDTVRVDTIAASTPSRPSKRPLPPSFEGEADAIDSGRAIARRHPDSFWGAGAEVASGSGADVRRRPAATRTWPWTRPWP